MTMNANAFFPLIFATNNKNNSPWRYQHTEMNWNVEDKKVLYETDNETRVHAGDHVGQLLVHPQKDTASYMQLEERDDVASTLRANNNKDDGRDVSTQVVIGGGCGKDDDPTFFDYLRHARNYDNGAVLQKVHPHGKETEPLLQRPSPPVSYRFDSAVFEITPERTVKKGILKEDTECRLQQKLQEAEMQILQLKVQQEEQARKHKNKLQELLFHYMPNNPINYSHFIGPMETDLVETSRQVGPYKMDKCVGQGGFGRVFAVTERDSGQQFALKRMAKSKLTRASQLDRLTNELQVLQQADHPNVLSSHQVLHGRQYIYIVTNLGCMDLFAYKQEWIGEVDTDAVLRIFSGIAQGVEYLHSIGVAHMDIKSENVLITANVSPEEIQSVHVQLCDFGLVGIAEDEPTDAIVMHGICGTQGYMAPEMLLHHQCEGRQADIWSMGVTLLELACGLPIAWDHIYEPGIDQEVLVDRLLQCMELVYDRDFYDDPILHYLVTSMLQYIPENRIDASFALGLLGDVNNDDDDSEREEGPVTARPVSSASF